MKLIAASVLALAVSLGATPAVAAGDPMANFHRQRLHWHACQQGPQDSDGQALDEAGAQCAEATVPLDYHRPRGRTITVALSRLRATDPAGRIGALVVNLGGPGIPVLASVPLARQAMGAAGARFDLIGMDPRFAGRSTPLDCGWPASWIPRSAGADRASFDRMVALERDLARRCAQRHGDLLPYASTVNTARDMDVVRAALGESRLSFLGYSYGTYLGALYTQLFPHRAGRVVLDSALDPAQPGTFKGRGNGPVREWAGWAAARDDRYHLGATVHDVLSTVDTVYRSSGIPGADSTVVPALLLDPLTDDSEESNVQLAERVRALATGQSTPDLDAALAGMLTGAGSALHSAQTAIMCADGAVPRDPEFYWRDIEAHRAEAPLFGPVNRNIAPCAFWPVGQAAAPKVHNTVPALVVNAAGDIGATLDLGQAMHRALAGSRMITLDGVRTHGVYLFQGNACVDGAVNAYLVTGALLAGDLSCARP